MAQISTNRTVLAESDEAIIELEVFQLTESKDHATTRRTASKNHTQLPRFDFDEALQNLAETKLSSQETTTHPSTPIVAATSDSLDHLRIQPGTVPEQNDGSDNRTAIAQLMTVLGGLLDREVNHGISLEIVGLDRQISFVLSVPRKWSELVIQHIYAALPYAFVESVADWSTNLLANTHAGSRSLTFANDADSLADLSMLDRDPLAAIFEQLGNLQDDELAVTQLIVWSTQRPDPLTQRILESTRSAATRLVHGKDSLPPLPEGDGPVKIIRANLRITAISPSSSTRTDQILDGLTSPFHQLTIPTRIKLQVNKPKHPSAWKKKIIHRQGDRTSSFDLTVQELVSLYHLPNEPKQFPQLVALPSVHLPPPTDSSDTGIELGQSLYRGQEKTVRLTDTDRLRHLYAIGQTGTGKSTLFRGLILQDIYNGNGCAYIDPHGETIDWLLERIPKKRLDDVLLFDPSADDLRLSLNMLEWQSPYERDLIIQELIQLFYKLFDPGTIGPQFEHWLRSAALTITEPDVRGTIVDIPRLFTDTKFQRATMRKVHHPAARAFWFEQMDKTAAFHKSEMLNYFTSKFGSFLGNDTMHDLLSQTHSSFDMRTLMDNRRILLVNLSKGKLGEHNAELLGSLLMLKLQAAALKRADVDPASRPPFFVYVDEFQTIASDTFASLLSEIRKYGVALHLTHQYSAQLPQSVKDAVLGNVGSILAFRIGVEDALWLAPYYAPLSRDDLTNISAYHFHSRILRNGTVSSPFTMRSHNFNPEPQAQAAAIIRERTKLFVAAKKLTSSSKNFLFSTDY